MAGGIELGFFAVRKKPGLVASQGQQQHKALTMAHISESREESADVGLSVFGSTDGKRRDQ
jgi:hypothetical protein